MRTQIEVHVKFRGGSIGGINWRGQSRSEGRRFACTLAVAGLARVQVALAIRPKSGDIGYVAELARGYHFG